MRAATLGRLPRSATSAFTIHGAARIWLLTVLMALVGVGLALRAVDLTSLPAPFQVPWWALAVLFYLVEVRVVHLQFQREAHTYTLSELPLVIGLFLATPTDLILAYVIGASAGLFIHRRPAPIKLAFNVSLFVLCAAASVTVFHLVAPVAEGPQSASAWLATFAATTTATCISLLAVNAAIRLAQGRTDQRRLALAVRFGLIVSATNTALALVGITLLEVEPRSIWLVAIPVLLMVVAWWSYRASIGEREQRDGLELLYEANGILHGTRELEAAIVALLGESRRVFRAGYAELILFTAEGRTEGLRTALGPQDEVEIMTLVRLDPTRDALRLEAIRDGSAFRALRPPRGTVREDRVMDQPITDAMVAPLRGERSLIGTFLMANRLGELGTFRQDELRLFQTLADHVGVALENGRLGRSLKDLSDLKEQLRYQALHDDLTGLGNRALFVDHVEHALARRDRRGQRPGRPVHRPG